MYRDFGRAEGRMCRLFTLEDSRYRVQMTDYGATLVSFIDKADGTDIVLGYDDVSGYQQSCPYMGATVGRVCNRIGQGRFMLSGRWYQLARNDRGNTLHGGISGFASRVWEAAEEPGKLVFRLVSPDGDEGFPGTLRVTASYELGPLGLVFRWTAASDLDTIVCLTNHAYFNLNGPSAATAMDLQLRINADQYVPIDANGLAEKDPADVAGTPFDFRRLKPIGRDIGQPDPQLANGQGYDHHFQVRGQGLREAAVLESKARRLTVTSDLPGLQLYTANFLDGKSAGKGGAVYSCRSAVCLETQYVPNAINYAGYAQPILRWGASLSHTTVYSLTEIDE